MIELLFGENSFEIERAVESIIQNSGLKPERLDGEKIEPNNLPDILCGATLFSDKRLVIIKDLSENKASWSAISNLLLRISDDIHLVLVESKVDKRSTAYKALKEMAEVHEFLPWSERDVLKAEKWTTEQAKNMGIKLDNKLAQVLVRRVGADEWQIFHALEKLSFVDSISEDIIRDTVEPNPTENVFELFETAIKGDLESLKNKLQILEQTEDVYRLSSLLYSQAFQLVAITAAESAGARKEEVSKDFGIHPFAVSKLESTAKRVGKNGAKKIIDIFVEADNDMKTSKADPWVIIRIALYKIAQTV